jgi:hypothetical protein
VRLGRQDDTPIPAGPSKYKSLLEGVKQIFQSGWMYGSCNQASLTTSAVSSTSHTTPSARRRAPFRSRRNKCRSQPRLAFNQLQVRNSVRPMHRLGPQPRSRLLVRTRRQRGAQSITRCRVARQRLFRAGPSADRTFSTARNPIACATSSTDEPLIGASSQPSQSSVLVAWRDGKICYATGHRSVP